MRVCVGISVHAEPGRLKATLASIEANTGQLVEVLLLPDGPDQATAATLGTLTTLRQLGTAEPRGTPSCFNRLVTGSDADVLVLLESGALVGPGWLDLLLAALRAHPQNGLAGPSTNLAWNEQGAFPRCEGNPAAVAGVAREAAQRFGADTRTLEPLHSLADFCYVVRREVVETIGAADERYGLGPCWEMDYNLRAARAGFRAVWACGAYVFRAPFTARRRREEALRFEASRRLYQDKFCALRLRGEKTDYERHCRGEECEHFAPRPLIELTIGTSGREPKPSARIVATPRPGSPLAAFGKTGDLDGHAGRAEEAAQAPNSAPRHPPGEAPQSASGLPLVSCIMPTRNRRKFVAQAIQYFLRQDYPRRELIVVDDGEDRIADLIPGDSRIHYVSRPSFLSIGAKRNLACELATGEIIAHWDDDDWYAPNRLSRQVAPLLTDAADLTGLEAGPFFDPYLWQAWTCAPELHRRLFVHDVHGGTLVYWRRIWERMARYPALSLAEDALFLREAVRRGARLARVENDGLFVYVRHDTNAWRLSAGTALDAAGWRPLAPEGVIPIDDRPFYESLRTAEMRPADRVEARTRASAPDPRQGPNHSGSPVPDPEVPLVSCVMPTYNRRQFLPLAISYFQRQDYPNRELIILDDGDDRVGDLIPADPRIRYVELERRMVLGAKRNLACQLANGEFIAHWDDDDWIAPHRLTYQVSSLLQSGADLCSTSRQLYFEPSAPAAWLYEYPASLRRWLAGNVLCYRKSMWVRNPFRELAIGEDIRFCAAATAANALALSDHTIAVGLIHATNSSRKVVTGRYWSPRPIEEVLRVIGDDYTAYQCPEFSAVPANANRSLVTSGRATATASKLV